MDRSDTLVAAIGLIVELQIDTPVLPRTLTIALQREEVPTAGHLSNDRILVGLEPSLIGFEGNTHHDPRCVLQFLNP